MERPMAVTDMLVGHLMTAYLCAIAAIKAYTLVTKRSVTGIFVLVASTALVGMTLIGAYTWDVSRKAAAHSLCGDRAQETCRGGICWHGVAVKKLQVRCSQHRSMQN